MTSNQSEAWKTQPQPGKFVGVPPAVLQEWVDSGQASKLEPTGTIDWVSYADKWRPVVNPRSCRYNERIQGINSSIWLSEWSTGDKDNMGNLIPKSGLSEKDSHRIKLYFEMGLELAKKLAPIGGGPNTEAIDPQTWLIQELLLIHECQSDADQSGWPIRQNLKGASYNWYDRYDDHLYSGFSHRSTEIAQKMYGDEYAAKLNQLRAEAERGSASAVGTVVGQVALVGEPTID